MREAGRIQCAFAPKRKQWWRSTCRRQRRGTVRDTVEIRLRAEATMLGRFLFGEDVFLSYSRSDAINYVTGLANELSKHGIECRTDLWDTEPGESLPRELRRS